MALLRAVSYFLSEALTSLWRSRLVNAVSIGTIAVSLFVLGAFLTVASALSGLVTRWTETVQVIVYLDDDVEPRVLASLENRLREDPAVASLELVTREQALARFRSMFHDLSSLPEDLGENPFPASLEADAAAEPAGARGRRAAGEGLRRGARRARDPVRPALDRAAVDRGPAGAGGGRVPRRDPGAGRACSRSRT